MKVLAENPNGGDSSKTLNASSLPKVGILQSCERRRTNAVFLYIFLAFLTLTTSLLTYTLYYSDIDRLKGYDNCGNICGQKNFKYAQWNCSGQDMTLKPILSVYTSECRDNFTDKYSEDYFRGKDISNYSHIAMCKISLGFFVPLALCLILIVMLHYTPNIAVWTILLVSWFTFTVSVVLNFSYEINRSILVISLICIISILPLLSLILFNYRNIWLVSRLLQKATRPLFEIMKIKCVTLGALIVSILILFIFNIIQIHMLTAGRLQNDGFLPDAFLEYIPDEIMTTASYLNRIVAIWSILIVFGIQEMTTSGAVAQWYTTKNQDDLSDVVLSSLGFTMINHLGTIALGSALIAIMLIPRLFLQFLAAFSSMREKADVALRYLDGFFTNSSYTMTAMYGTCFVQSGKKASKLLNVSIGNTRELNNFGNFVIIVAQCFVILISTVIGFFPLHDTIYKYNIYASYFTLIFCEISTLCSFTILETLKVSLNTVFFCETEELWRNKECNEPFAMTMKELVDGSNKLFVEKVQSKPPWYVREKSCYIKLSLFFFVCASIAMYLISYFII